MVTSFKVLAIDITNSKETSILMKTYANAVTGVDRDSRKAFVAQEQLETYVGNRLGKASKIIGGKIGRNISSDYLVPTSSSLLQALYKDLKEDDYKQVEFKASTLQAATIGRFTVDDKPLIYIPGRAEAFSGTSIKQKILGSKAGLQSGYLLDLDKNLPRDASPKELSKYIFTKYLGRDERLKQLFYQKASTLLLANSYNLNGESGNRLIAIAVPLQFFNHDNFKAAIQANSIIISINDTFQNKIIREINENYLDAKKKIKGRRKTFVASNKKYTIDYLPIQDGNDFLGLEITNSIKVRPNDTFTLRVANNVPSEDSNAVKPQKFISAGQWTYLVRKRLEQTMGRGEPNPPFLKERTGRFRNSVELGINYRNRAIQYIYNPLYSSLEAYGYTPNLQIEGAIRDVAKYLYTKEFNIFEGNR